MSDSDSSEGSSDGEYYGPALPPHLQKSSINLEAEDNQVQSRTPEATVIVGPLVVGEVDNGSLPSTKQPPPVIVTHTALPSIGPTLPPGFKLPSSSTTTTHFDVDEEEADEPSEEDDSDGDDDNVIGPLPPSHPLALARAAAFDSVLKPWKEDKPKKKLQREEWMLIPPSNKPVTELGLGPRKFLQRAPEKPVKDNGEPMDSDEELERETRAALDQQIIDDYDKKMESMIQKGEGDGKRKTESLLEQHQRELKKKSKLEKSEETKRKPFDRNTDLAVGGLSREDSKKYVEKTKELGGRFSKGRQKFL